MSSTSPFDRPSTWLNCGYSRIVTSSVGQPAGIEQRQQRVPRRPEPARRADRQPGQLGRIGGHVPASPMIATGKRWYSVETYVIGMPDGARDHDVGRIGHAELGLAIGHEALDVGRRRCSIVTSRPASA